MMNTVLQRANTNTSTQIPANVLILARHKWQEHRITTKTGVSRWWACSDDDKILGVAYSGNGNSFAIECGGKGVIVNMRWIGLNPNVFEVYIINGIDS